MAHLISDFGRVEAEFASQINHKVAEWPSYALFFKTTRSVRRRSRHGHDDVAILVIVGSIFCAHLAC
jgi:hypothetical protein